MRHWKQWLVAAVLCLLSSVALAAPSTIDVSNMTPEQQAAVRALAQQLEKRPNSDASKVLDAIKDVDSATISRWAEAGTQAGKAVANFTTEISIPVKEFMDSFPGRAIFIIVFMNYGGGKLASFAIQIVIFAILTPFFLVFMNRIFRRFVLHQRLGHDKTWMPVRTEEEGQDIAMRDPTIKVNTGEAILGWVFIVCLSTFYLATMWPRWPS